MSDRLENIGTAVIDWTDRGPVNTKFGDVYRSRDGATDEATHVFIEANRIPERAAGRHLRVAETGFGTALNLLLTWRATARVGGRLEYFSVESTPPADDDMRRLLDCQGVGGADVERLLGRLPDRVPGWHRIDLDTNCRLWLGYGDALARYGELTTTMDAWYLDGHAARCNPDMWSDDLMDDVARLSGPGTTLATWASTGTLRRALAKRGFDVHRLEGFGHKTHRTVAVRAGSPSNSEGRIRSATVIGAGLAGAHIAARLASEDIDIRVLDPLGPAGGTSGNPAGIHKPLINATVTDMSRAALTAWGLGRRSVLDLTESGRVIPHDFHGTFQEAHDRAMHDRITGSLESHRPPAGLIEWQDDERPGAWFSKGGWISPGDWCRALCDHPRISVERSRVDTSDDPRLQDAEAVVIAIGHALPSLLPDLPVDIIRGQLHVVEESDGPPHPFSAGGNTYLIPLQGRTLVGASFEKNLMDPEPRADSSEQLLEECRKRIPSRVWPARLEGEIRVGFRTFMRDHRPVAGALPDLASCLRLPSSRRHDLRSLPRDGRRFVCAGLGSRGLLWSPWLADVVSRQMTGGPRFSLDDAVDPARFVRREIASGRVSS